MSKIKDYLGKSRLRSASYLLIIMLFSWYCFFGYKYGFAYTIGESMDPTHKDGEMMVVQNIRNLGKDWAPSKWDVVIILDKKEKEKLAKRVVGLEGDKIQIKEGLIYLNGEELKGPYGHGKISIQYVDDDNNDLYFWGTNEKAVENIDEREIIIPKGHVWLIGDNRSVSWYGILPIKDIKALVIF
ncbi:signal peptidase I [bacterium]|nr:signal peptidase I [bacterium]